MSRQHPSRLPYCSGVCGQVPPPLQLHPSAAHRAMCKKREPNMFQQSNYMGFHECNQSK